MNKNAQADPLTLGIAIFLGIILLSVLIPVISDMFNSITCEDEKQQIKDLQSQLLKCNELKDRYKSLLDNCQGELNNSESDCEDRIQNVTQYYTSKIENNEIVIHFERKIKTLMILFLIPLGLSLLTFEIKLRRSHEKVLFFLKVLFWVAYLFILFVAYENFFTSFFLT